MAPTIELVENPDILADLVGRRVRRAPHRSWSVSRPRPATTTSSVLDHARAKLARKGCDLLVVNDVSGGAVFGDDDNQAVILGADGTEQVGATGIEVGAGTRDLGRRVVWTVVGCAGRQALT